MFDIPSTPSRYSLHLAYQEGASDKVYTVRISPLGGDRWETKSSWGRRGSTLQHKVKVTDAPYARARQAADALAREKVGKGYHVVDEETEKVGASPAPIPAPRKPSPPPAPKKPDFIPSAQLAAPVDQTMIDALINDDALVAQEKLYGERRMIVKTADRIVGYNRRGLEVVLPDAIVAAASAVAGTFAIDGEAIGDVVHAFDLLERNSTEMTKLPLEARLAYLDILASNLGTAIPVVATASVRTDKRNLAADVRARSGEGLVFKRRASLYAPGRPSGEASWLKVKFYDTLSAIVTAHNAQRSVALALKTDAEMNDLPVGNVTIPVNADIPPVGAVVEVRYLFAYDNGGSLYEPCFLGQRSDIAPEECLASQRKFKPPVAA